MQNGGSLRQACHVVLSLVCDWTAVRSSRKSWKTVREETRSLLENILRSGSIQSLSRPVLSQFNVKNCCQMFRAQAHTTSFLEEKSWTFILTLLFHRLVTVIMCLLVLSGRVKIESETFLAQIYCAKSVFRKFYVGILKLLHCIAITCLIPVCWNSGFVSNRCLKLKIFL